MCLKDPCKILYILLSLHFLSRPGHHPYFSLLSFSLLVSFSVVFLRFPECIFICNIRCVFVVNILLFSQVSVYFVLVFLLLYALSASAAFVMSFLILQCFFEIFSYI